MLRIGGAAAAVALAVGVANGVHAAGFYLQEQSVRAIGRAYSGEAADRGPESLWWNPAAIGGTTENNAYFGMTGILPSGELRNENSQVSMFRGPFRPVGGTQVKNDPVRPGVPPSGAFAYRLTDSLAIGMALTSPFSVTTKYGPDSWARYAAGKTKLLTIDLQPSIGWAATDWLRFGGGLNVEYADATLTNRLPNLLPSQPDGNQELAGDGWNLGWTLGAQADLGQVTIGLSYKSSVRHRLGGQATITGLTGLLASGNGVTDTTATFRTPWQLIGGVRVRATDRLTLNLQAIAFGWSRFDAISLGTPFNVLLAEDYRDSWNLAVGVDYALDPQWILRAGFQYDWTPTRPSARDARVPDGTRRTFAAGATWRFTDQIAIDAAFSYVDVQSGQLYKKDVLFPGTVAQTPILTVGRQSGQSAVIGALGLVVRF